MFNEKTESKLRRNTNDLYNRYYIIDIYTKLEI